MHDREIEKMIKEIEKRDGLNYDYGRKNPFNFLFDFLPSPGEIDLEIAQLICDLIIDRLNAKGVITKSNGKSLSDYYEYINDMDVKISSN